MRIDWLLLALIALFLLVVCFLSGPVRAAIPPHEPSRIELLARPCLTRFRAWIFVSDRDRFGCLVFSSINRRT